MSLILTVAVVIVGVVLLGLGWLLALTRRPTIPRAPRPTRPVPVDVVAIKLTRDGRWTVEETV